ncbi:MAG: hypothetical protein JWR84_4076, partial [Caulobacter sp.]|nr:hypothetical protein [Caulobacter sp.]
ATTDCLDRIWLFALNDHGQVLTLQQERPHGPWGTWQPRSYLDHYR